MACNSIRLYKENKIYLQFHPTLNFKANRENKVKQIKNRSKSITQKSKETVQSRPSSKEKMSMPIKNSVGLFYCVVQLFNSI